VSAILEAADRMALAIEQDHAPIHDLAGDKIEACPLCESARDYRARCEAA